MPENYSPSAGFETPVLLLIFNRPDTTRRVLEAIRQVRPTRLYVAADGPRPHRPADEALCAETRALVHELVDWPCAVQTLFRASNLNCGVAPATAIDWFFQHEEEGIILEDDCVPARSFFPFCAELLARYRHDTRVMHIGGNNFAAEAAEVPRPGTESYHFSNQVNSWGWATWRRAWQHFDFRMQRLPELEAQGKLKGIYSSWLEERYRLSKIRSVLSLPQPPDVWDYQWHFAIAANSGLCIVPAVNLVGNIGFGAQGTHTMDAADSQADVPTLELPFPLHHPHHVLIDRPRDRRRFQEFLQSRIRAKLSRLFPRRAAASHAAPTPAPASVLAPPDAELLSPAPQA